MLPKMRVVKALAIFAVTGVVAPASAFGNCGPAATRDPGPSSLRAARKATLCLLNRERAKHGLRRLRFNHKLALAGLEHARDMVSNQYFSHDEPGGPNFVDRILATNYVPASASYSLAENLAWGSGSASSPLATVRGWMASPGHRRNILMRGFREIGIAIVLGDPVQGQAGGATYATEFGAVHRR